MKHARWLILPTLALMVGCDFAAIAWLAGKDDSSSDDGGALIEGGSSGPIFAVWVGDIPNDTVANDELTDLNDSGGQPSTDTWTPVGDVSASAEFGLSGNPSSFNAILIRAAPGHTILVDCVEILDANDNVLEYASGQTWSGQVDFPDRILGAPDASAAVTNATGSAWAFIFCRFSGPFTRFRINGQIMGQPPAPGDTTGSGEISSGGSESPGGSAVDLVSGLLNVPINLAGSIFLAQFDSDAGLVDSVQIASGVTAAEGSESVAIDSNRTIYVASTVSSGEVQVRQFAPNLGAGWTVTFSSGLGGDRVESNGLAVDAGGNIVVSGGRNALLTGVSHWMARLAPSGAVMWERSQDDDVSGPTYWRGVTTDGSGQIFSSGDLNPALVGGTNQVRTSRISALGVAQWSDEYAESGSSSNLGRAVAIKSSGEIIVGGYVGTTNQGRNGLLLRYSSSGSVTSVAVHNGPASGDDEIMDVEVDSDGSVFVAGYETVAGQGENWWVRKYAPSGAVAWTRTYDGGNGNDRAVSLSLSGSKVFVAGTRTNGSGQRKFMLRVYAK